MRRKEGCHFYINIANLNEVVTKEEERTGNVTHAVHALDTFFSSIEAYGKKNYSDIFVVEKVTGSRLHMYVTDDITKAYSVIIDIAVYAYALSSYLNKNVGKYKSLLDFDIQVGCCYGKFYDFIFKMEEKEEETTIGYAANYAAKLQSITSIGFLSISENIYEELEEEQKSFFSIKMDGRITKYGQSCYYTANLSKFNVAKRVESGLEYAKEVAYRVNLNEMSFATLNSKINLDYLTKKESKKIEGIPLFADVRGFTSQFKDDDSNLAEMAKKTQDILMSMYKIVNREGTHVQFQGDREFALYHNFGDYDCCEDAVLAGMRIIDAVHEFQVCVGVGQSLGKLFVSKIGARGEKDIVVLGHTVIEADSFEDDFAKANQLVIGTEIYQVLHAKNIQLAGQFKRLNDRCYCTNVGYKKFMQHLEDNRLTHNNQQRNYNGAWRA